MAIFLAADIILTAGGKNDVLFQHTAAKRFCAHANGQLHPKADTAVWLSVFRHIGEIFSCGGKHFAVFLAAVASCLCGMLPPAKFAQIIFQGSLDKAGGGNICRIFCFHDCLMDFLRQHNQPHAQTGHEDFGKAFDINDTIFII